MRTSPTGRVVEAESSQFGSRGQGANMAEDAAEAVPAAAPVAAPTSSRKVLVVGDETFLYTEGLQEAYPDVEFTACSVLSTTNITAKEANPFPPSLKGRVKHMQNPMFIGKQYPAAAFDELLFFLPGLSFAVPKELGTSDRPLYAYRLHHYVFHLLRSTKAGVLKRRAGAPQNQRILLHVRPLLWTKPKFRRRQVLLKGESDLHVVWPEETCLMSSPCGAAGIELASLLRFLGCKQQPDAKYSIDKVKPESMKPIVFGTVQSELPEWLHGMQMLHFTIDTVPIKVPLSVALQIHPDLELVGLKERSSIPGVDAPADSAPLKAQLVHEAVARKARLKDMYGPHENGEMPSSYDLVREAPAPDPGALLSVPMEVFMMSFDELPHFANCMRFQVVEDQPPISHATIDVLDPRLPTRVARPAPVVLPTPMPPPMIAVKKRSRPKEEEWGEMKFYCPLTKIATPTTEKMRLHMEGELYKKFAARDPNWDTSDDKKDLLFDLEEEEAKKAKKDKGKGDSKGGKGKGGKSKGKSDGKSKDGKSKGGKSKGKGGGKSRY